MTKAKGTNKRLFVFLLSILLIFVGFYTFFGSNGLMEILRRKSMEEDLQVKLETLKKDNIQLRSLVWSLQNMNFEVERIAREVLFMVKPGERVYLVEEEER